MNSCLKLIKKLPHIIMICDTFYSLQNNLLWTLLCADSAACTFLLINISYIVYYMDSI